MPRCLFAHEPARHTGRRRRSGTAATELVLTLPLMVTLLLGLVDYGRVIDCELIVANAARVGAEYGATHKVTATTRPSWESAVRLAVLNEAVARGAIPDTLQVDVDVVQPSHSLALIEVRVSLVLKTAAPWPGQLPLSHTVTMREYR